MKWYYDRESRALLTKAEYEKLRAERADKYGQKHYDLAQKFERGHWKLDKITRKLVPLSARRLEVVAPIIQTDELPAPVESMATANREMFTSKRKLYDHYKAHGVTVKEKGMLEVTPSLVKETDERDLRNDIEKALNQLRWNEVPLTEKEKAICRMEQREWEAYKKRQRA